MPTVVRALRLVTILGGIVVGAFILWASLVNAAERQERHSGAGRLLSERAVERRAVEAVVITTSTLCAIWSEPDRWCSGRANSNRVPTRAS